MNRKVLLMCACITLLLSSCTSYTAMYNIPLTSVTPPGEATKKVEKQLGKVDYEDDYIEISLICGAKSIYFELKNKTAKTAKIIWDEASIVDYTGATQRVTHIGVRLMDRDASKPPTAIPAGSVVKDEATPVSNIYLDRMQWKTAGLFPMFYKSKSDQEAKQYEGKIIKLLLPLDFSGERKDYVFEFLIEKFTGFQSVNYLP